MYLPFLLFNQRLWLLINWTENITTTNNNSNNNKSNNENIRSIDLQKRH